MSVFILKIIILTAYFNKPKFYYFLLFSYLSILSVLCRSGIKGKELCDSVNILKIHGTKELFSYVILSI